jgi:hypothetical protein
MRTVVLALAFVLAAATLAFAKPPPSTFAPLPGRPGGAAAPVSAAPHPAVARIIVPEGGAVGFGSGTLVDVRGEQGLVLTNWHVVRDAEGDVTVVFPDGFRSAARVLHTDRDWDLAALLIWRPGASPVPIASQPPRPGDRLTIAGYGGGTYRALSGRCTQYVAPGMQFPYEMVEVSVEARQGDSGGPIFNDRGELAGVLFGAGRGTTAGSYAGRVQNFLAALAPDIGRGDSAIACVPAVPPCGRSDALARLPPTADATAATPMTAALVPVPPPARTAEPVFPPGPAVASASPTWPPRGSHRANDPLFSPGGLPPRTQTVDLAGAAGADDGWATLTGGTPLEQAKSALAAVGVLAVVLLLLGAATAEKKK